MADKRTRAARHLVEVLGLTDTIRLSKGLGTMWRVMRIEFRTPLRAAFSLIATLPAAVLHPITRAGPAFISGA